MERNFEKSATGEIPGFRILENECIWMRAGIVSFRLCDKDYDCLDCKFDLSMRQAMEAQSPARGRHAQAGWAREMRNRYVGMPKPCVYFLADRISSPQYCNRDYECDECPVNMELEYEKVAGEIEAERQARLEVVPEGVLEARRDVREERRGAPGLERACVWMKAGVINFRLCDNDYDCFNCDFDSRMRLAMDESNYQEWMNRHGWYGEMNERFSTDKRPCIHFLSGKKDAPSECSFNYDCHRCGFHRSQTAAGDMNKTREPAYEFASGYRLAEDFYYHFGHTWVHVEQGGRVRAGFDEFASKAFGAADRLEIPPEGTKLKQGEAGLVLSREGRQAAVRSPISGKVVAVNREVIENPGLCHDDPYGRGWLFCVEPSFLKTELDALYYGKEALEWTERENQEVMKLLGPKYEQLVSTGAEPVDDLFGHVPELEWDKLAQSILRTEEKSD